MDFLEIQYGMMAVLSYFFELILSYITIKLIAYAGTGTDASRGTEEDWRG